MGHPVYQDLSYLLNIGNFFINQLHSRRFFIVYFRMGWTVHKIQKINALKLSVKSYFSCAHLNEMQIVCRVWVGSIPVSPIHVNPSSKSPKHNNSPVICMNYIPRNIITRDRCSCSQTDLNRKVNTLYRVVQNYCDDVRELTDTEVC